MGKPRIRRVPGASQHQRLALPPELGRRTGPLPSPLRRPAVRASQSARSVTAAGPVSRPTSQKPSGRASHATDRSQSANHRRSSDVPTPTTAQSETAIAELPVSGRAAVPAAGSSAQPWPAGSSILTSFSALARRRPLRVATPSSWLVALTPIVRRSPAGGHLAPTAR